MFSTGFICERSSESIGSSLPELTRSVSLGSTFTAFSLSNSFLMMDKSSPPGLSELNHSEHHFSIYF